MGTILPAEYGEINENISFYAQSSVSFTLVDLKAENHKGWQFKIPFGSFYLFAVIGLLFLQSDKKTYALLSGFHLLMGVTTVILVVIGIKFSTALLIVVDFISRYLLPLGSFGYVAFLYGKLKMNNRLYANQT